MSTPKTPSPGNGLTQPDAGTRAGIGTGELDRPFFDVMTKETVRIVGPGFIGGWREVEKSDGDTYMARWNDLLKICHRCGAHLSHNLNEKGADAFQGCDCSQPEWMAHE